LWDAAQQLWKVPLSSTEHLVALLRHLKVSVPQDVLNESYRQSYYSSGDPSSTITFTKDGCDDFPGFVKMTFNYNAGIIECIHMLDLEHRVFQPLERAWFIKATEVPLLLDCLVGQEGYCVDDALLRAAQALSDEDYSQEPVQYIPIQPVVPKYEAFPSLNRSLHSLSSVRSTQSTFTRHSVYQTGDWEVRTQTMRTVRVTQKVEVIRRQNRTILAARVEEEDDDEEEEIQPEPRRPDPRPKLVAPRKTEPLQTKKVESVAKAPHVEPSKPAKRKSRPPVVVKRRTSPRLAQARRLKK
jgi:hypothetical protein